jgi:hypothetical protein
MVLGSLILLLITYLTYFFCLSDEYLVYCNILQPLFMCNNCDLKLTMDISFILFICIIFIGNAYSGKFAHCYKNLLVTLDASQCLPLFATNLFANMYFQLSWTSITWTWTVINNCSLLLLNLILLIMHSHRGLALNPSIFYHHHYEIFSLPGISHSSYPPVHTDELVGRSQCFRETMVSTYKPTMHYYPEDFHWNLHHHQNLRSHRCYTSWQYSAICDLHILLSLWIQRISPNFKPSYIIQL